MSIVCYLFRFCTLLFVDDCDYENEGDSALTNMDSQRKRERKKKFTNNLRRLPFSFPSTSRHLSEQRLQVPPKLQILSCPHEQACQISEITSRPRLVNGPLKLSSIKMHLKEFSKLSICEIERNKRPEVISFLRNGPPFRFHR